MFFRPIHGHVIARKVLSPLLTACLGVRRQAFGRFQERYTVKTQCELTRGRRGRWTTDLNTQKSPDNVCDATAAAMFSLLLSFQNKPLARCILSVPATASFCVGDCRETRPGAVLREAESRRMLWNKPDAARALPEGSARGDLVSASLGMALFWNRVS